MVQPKTKDDWGNHTYHLRRETQMYINFTAFVMRCIYDFEFIQEVRSRRIVWPAEKAKLMNDTK